MKDTRPVKSQDEKDKEHKVINNFLDICAPSLDPPTMNYVRCAVEDLIEVRRLDPDSVYSWGQNITLKVK